MREIDLMLDCKFVDDSEVKTTFHIIQFSDDHFNVVHDGRVATALGWDEMLGQIINLVGPSRRLYPMQTREEFKAARKQHEQRKSA